MMLLTFNRGFLDGVFSAAQIVSVDSEPERIRELLQALWKENRDNNIRLKEIINVVDTKGLDIQDHWFDDNGRAHSTKAGKYRKNLVERDFTIDHLAG